MIGNHVCGYTVPRVQIPLSPPFNEQHLRWQVLFFYFVSRVLFAFLIPNYSLDLQRNECWNPFMCLRSYYYLVVG